MSPAQWSKLEDTAAHYLAPRVFLSLPLYLANKTKSSWYSNPCATYTPVGLTAYRLTTTGTSPTLAASYHMSCFMLTWRNIMSAAVSPLIRLRFLCPSRSSRLAITSVPKLPTRLGLQGTYEPVWPCGGYRFSLLRHHHERAAHAIHYILIDFLRLAHRPLVGDDLTGGS